MTTDAGDRLPWLTASLSRQAARQMLTKTLADAGIDSAELDARLLLCAGLGIDPMELIAEPRLPLGGATILVRSLARRRLDREPVSRILGYRDFWDARFEITGHVLDPRPDTETLVEAVLDDAKMRAGDSLRILDLGVGSGAILCALLRSLPAWFGVGIDISAAACTVARTNLARLGLGARATIVCADWTEAVSGRFDVIVSNPPYIVHDEIDGLELEVRDHDPVLALDGGNDGLDAYRRIVPRLPHLLAAGGLVAFEHGPGQGAALAAWLHKAGFSRIWAVLDLGGRERGVLAVKA